MASLDDEQPPWLAEDGVAPLVQAYEARIRELRSQNNSQAKSLLELRHELDAVVQENDNLRADLKLATEKLMSQLREQPLHASQSGLAAMNTVEELQRLLQLAAEERSLTQQSIESLEAENSQYRSKLEQCRDALQAKAGFEDSARKAMSALAAEKHAAESMLSSLSNRATSAEASVADWARKYDALQADKIELESELSAARNSAEELASQLRMESDAYENRIRALNDRLTEMRALCDQQERQLEAQADDVSQKQHELEVAKKDCEDMIKVMQEWERKVSAYAAQEKQWERETQAARDEVQHAKLEVTKTQAQEARIKRELAWMVERRQIETDEAIAHERAAVEDIRSRLSAAISSRDDDISKLIDECKKLQWRVERAERDYHDALRELESSNVRFNEEQDKAYSQLEEAVRAQKRAVGDAEEAKCSAVAARLDLATAQERWDAERRELASTIENLRDALASERAAGSEEAAALRARLTDTSSALSRSVAREEDRLAELSRLRIESGMAKQRCEASEKRVRMLQEQAQSFMRRQQLHVTDG